MKILINVIDWIILVFIDTESEPILVLAVKNVYADKANSVG